MRCMQISDNSKIIIGSIKVYEDREGNVMKSKAPMKKMPKPMPKPGKSKGC